MNISHIRQFLGLKSNRFIVLVSAAVACFIVIIFMFLFLKSSSSPDFKTELENLSSAVRAYFQQQVDYRGLDTAFVVKKQIVPQDMVRKNKIFSKNKAEILIGGDVNGQAVAPFSKNFGIIYLNLNRKKCQEILTTKLDVSAGLTSINILNEDNYSLSYGGEFKLPVSKERAKQYCKAVNTVMFVFE